MDLDLIFTLLDKGWLGILSLIVAKWVYQERVQKKHPNGNPHPYVKEPQLNEVKEDIRAIQETLNELGQRVAHIEGAQAHD